MSSFSLWPLIRVSYYKNYKKENAVKNKASTMEVSLKNSLHFKDIQTSLKEKTKKVELPRNPLDATSDEYFWKPVAISLMFKSENQAQWIQDQENGWNIRSPYEQMTGVWWACKKK